MGKHVARNQRDVAYSSADYADSDIPLTRVNAYQDMKFWANQDGVAQGSDRAQALDRYIVADQWGNQTIMHVSGQAADRL